MKLCMQIIKLLFNKFILRKNTGTLLKEFASEMGIVYIKMAQILSTQNYGNKFTEEDRELLSDICDDCNQIPYSEIEKILKEEYKENFDNIFAFIDEESRKSASVSQVHRAVLKTGEEVAIKVKRKDVTKKIEEDINTIRKIVHRCGKFAKFKKFKFRNYIGSDHALDLYLEWILQETDFRHEIENIKLYQHFADNVNDKVKDTKQIRVPKLYEEYCTDNIIVMEFIKTPTINKMELTDENKKKIADALNSYIKSSFWAMYNDQQIVFHGDPHSGNIVIDDNGNICFLDMGLLYYLSDNDAKLLRKFFFAAYAGNYEKLYEMLIPYGNMSESKKKSFKEDCKKFCEEIKNKEVTYYFVDMINICLNYNFDPPKFLFGMAKAFVCINGISKFSDNTCTARELLEQQVIEFMVKRTLNDCKKTIKSLDSPKKMIENTSKYGIIDTVAKQLSSDEFKRNCIILLENVREMCEMAKSYEKDLSDKLKEEEQLRYRNTNNANIE